jgi:hypothetical protein
LLFRGFMKLSVLALSLRTGRPHAGGDLAPRLPLALAEEAYCTLRLLFVKRLRESHDMRQGRGLLAEGTEILYGSEVA